MTVPSVGKGEEQLEFSYNAGGNVTWSHLFGKQRGSFSKLNIHLPYEQAIPLLDTYSSEMKTCPHKDLYTSIHSMLIHNSQILETIPISINRRMNKQIMYMYYLYNAVLPSSKNEWNANTHNTNESHR